MEKCFILNGMITVSLEVLWESCYCGRNMPGVFSKYINNDGDIIEPRDKDFGEICKKAESLVHFTNNFLYNILMALDIQVTGFWLYDPEIVSTDLMQTIVQATFQPLVLQYLLRNICATSFVRWNFKS